MSRPTMLDGTYALHWRAVNRLVEHYAVGDDWDPHRLWGLPASGAPEPLPQVGPVVYAAVSGQRCFWVGQTDDLRGRLAGHLTTQYRRDRWPYVAAIVLKPETPSAIINRLETETARRLRPVDGKAWPRIA